MDFVHIDENPCPAGAEFAGLAMPDGAVLRAAYFRAENGTGPCVVLLPGYAEFIEKYFEVIGELQGRGFDVAILDWRGQGFSSRLVRDIHKGHLDDFKTHIEDFRTFLSTFVRARTDGRLLLLGHSMGGAITLLYLEQGGAPEAAVLSAPMTDLFPSAGKRLLTRVSSEIACLLGLSHAQPPQFATRRVAGEDELSHDPRRVALFAALQDAAPSAVIDRPTWGWLRAAIRATDKIRASKALAASPTPVLLFSARQETLVDPASHEQLACDLQNARLVRLPSSAHEILMETDDIRAVFWSEFDAFSQGVITGRTN